MSVAAGSRWLEARVRPILVSLFVVLALPTVLIQVFLTPPFQVADEENHFLRALQVSTGHVFGRKIEGDNAGGQLDPQARSFAHAFDALKFDAGKKLDPAVVADVAAERWGGASGIATDFPNTAIYPFFFYLPASAALLVGRLVDLTILDSFFLARLCTALASVAFAALALSICRQGRTLLFVVLCFPMTLSLFAAVSQDAMSIALGSVAITLWSRFVSLRAPMPAWARALVSVILGAVAAGRLPLLLLAVLALLPTRSPPKGSRPRIRDVAAASCGLLPLLFGVYGAYRAKVPFRVSDGVSPALQLRWLASHPAEAVGVAVRTLSENTQGLAQEAIGVLGWLDTVLPSGFYVAMSVCLVLAATIEALEPNRVLVRGWGWLAPLSAVTAAAAIFATFYLVWTPVGAATIEGVQGRYFLLPLIVLVVSFPRLPRLEAGGATRWLGGAQVVLCGGVALMDLSIVPITVFHRYYG